MVLGKYGTWRFLYYISVYMFVRRRLATCSLNVNSILSVPTYIIFYFQHPDSYGDTTLPCIIIIQCNCTRILYVYLYNYIVCVRVKIICFYKLYP
jgi:hypothetical protein